MTNRVIPSKRHKINIRTLAALVALTSIFVLSACEQTPQLQRIQQQGTLIVATRHAATTYYQGANGPEGLEYELIERFAKTLGVTTKFVFPDDVGSLITQVENGQVHMGAAGLTVTPQRLRKLNFSQSYQSITEQLVYRRGNKRPRRLADIAPGQLHLIVGSSHLETMLREQKRYPKLQWVEHSGIRSERLLQQVGQGTIPFTMADSNELARAKRIYPYLKSAFDIGNEQALAWAFPKRTDDSLRKAANAFLAKLEDNGTLEALLKHYYANIDQLNFVDKRELSRNFHERLPRYQKYFKEAAEISAIDWRLLAAIGYQESHWRPKAVSPTGVRGIMMLTQGTAKQLKIKDRTDPRASIIGGARYFNIVAAKLPKRIPEKERIWFTLAAYNIGFGHLEDARVLTQQQGGNPDVWEDVRERLPLLSNPKYHKTTKYGYARGKEPVVYVDNIRSYYDLIVWYDNYQTEAQ